MGEDREYMPGPFRRSPKKRRIQPMCRTCGAKDVKWVKRATGSWVLVDIAGGRHSCTGPVTADSFDDLTE